MCHNELYNAASIAENTIQERMKYLELKVAHLEIGVKV